VAISVTQLKAVGVGLFEGTHQPRRTGRGEKVEWLSLSPKLNLWEWAGLKEVINQDRQEEVNRWSGHLSHST